MTKRLKVWEVVEPDWEEESKNWIKGAMVSEPLDKEHLKGVWDEGDDKRIDL